MWRDACVWCASERDKCMNVECVCVVYMYMYVGRGVCVVCVCICVWGVYVCLQGLCAATQVLFLDLGQHFKGFLMFGTSVLFT